MAKQKVLLATTTSLYDTGRLDYLKPKFEQMYNVDLLITSQGTGKAIELAKNGDADILMVHSPAQEKAFIDGGNGINPRCFAYNYFVIVGPANDPAGIRNMSPLDAMAKLRELGVKNIHQGSCSHRVATTHEPTRPKRGSGVEPGSIIPTISRNPVSGT